MLYCTGCNKIYGCLMEKKEMFCANCEKEWCSKKIFYNRLKAQLGYCNKCRAESEKQRKTAKNET